MEKVIYLEPDDEITVVIDKIRRVSQEKVILVVPKAATILQSIVNLKLLKKEAVKLGKGISIVTSDDTGRNLASQIGLTVYRDIAKRPPVEEPAAPDRSKDTKREESISTTPAETVGEEKTEKPEAALGTELEEETSIIPKKQLEEKTDEAIYHEKPEKKSPVLDIHPSAVKSKPYKDGLRAALDAIANHPLA